MDVSLFDSVADKYLQLEKRTLSENDVLFLRFGLEVAIDDARDCIAMLRNLLDADGYQAVTVLALPSHLQLDHLTEKDMNDLGWQRRDESRGYKWL